MEQTASPGHLLAQIWLLCPPPSFSTSTAPNPAGETEAGGGGERRTRHYTNDKPKRPGAAVPSPPAGLGWQQGGPHTSPLGLSPGQTPPQPRPRPHGATPSLRGSRTDGTGRRRAAVSTLPSPTRTRKQHPPTSARGPHPSFSPGRPRPSSPPQTPKDAAVPELPRGVAPGGNRGTARRPRPSALTEQPSDPKTHTPPAPLPHQPPHPGHLLSEGACTGGSGRGPRSSRASASRRAPSALASFAPIPEGPRFPPASGAAAGGHRVRPRTAPHSRPAPAGRRDRGGPRTRQPSPRPCGPFTFVFGCGTLNI